MQVDATIDSTTIHWYNIKNVKRVPVFTNFVKETLQGIIKVNLVHNKFKYIISIGMITTADMQTILNEMEFPRVDFTYNNTQWTTPPSSSSCYIEITGEADLVAGQTSETMYYDMELTLTEIDTRSLANFP